MARIWDELIGDLDRAVYQKAGYGGKFEPGTRPALLVIDVTFDFVGDRPEPILDSIEKFPNSCGEAGWRGVAAISKVLAAARARDVPTFYTRGTARPTALTRGAWGWKKTNEKALPEISRRIGTHFPDPIAPTEADVILEKTKPSAFFGTPLASYLTALGVDTLLVTGSTTSGCIRATVVDAFSHNFRTVVVEDGVFDRSEFAHRANLFDMYQKYAQVLPSEDVVAYLAKSDKSAATP